MPPDAPLAPPGDPVTPPRVVGSVREVYTTHASYVLRCLRYLGVPPNDLDDALQEVFLVVHRKLTTLAPSGSLRSWLYAVALQVARRSRRTRQRLGATVEAPAELIEPGDERQQAETRASLLSLLAHLDDDKREAVVLYHLEQLTLQEIAEATGVPLQTVYSRLKAGMLLLAQARGAAPGAP
jgi:RNA polymerase sigma-70 factor (ECF subfamily)